MPSTGIKRGKGRRRRVQGSKLPNDLHAVAMQAAFLALGKETQVSADIPHSPGKRTLLRRPKSTHRRPYDGLELSRLPQHDKQPATGTSALHKRVLPHHKQPGAEPKDPISFSFHLVTGDKVCEALVTEKDLWM